MEKLAVQEATAIAFDYIEKTTDNPYNIMSSNQNIINVLGFRGLGLNDLVMILSYSRPKEFKTLDIFFKRAQKILREKALESDAMRTFLSKRLLDAFIRPSYTKPLFSIEEGIFAIDDLFSELDPNVNQSVRDRCFNWVGISEIVKVRIDTGLIKSINCRSRSDKETFFSSILEIHQKKADELRLKHYSEFATERSC